MLINRRTIRIEWGDCDPAGIVFYPRYFEWFDACAAALFEDAGFLRGDLVGRQGIFIPNGGYAIQVSAPVPIRG